MANRVALNLLMFIIGPHAIIARLSALHFRSFAPNLFIHPPPPKTLHPSPSICYQYSKDISHTQETERKTAVNFDLDEEQSEIRDMVRRFTEREITPYAGAWDENNHFPREIYTHMAELGLMGMTTPEEYSGSNLS